MVHFYQENTHLNFHIDYGQNIYIKGLEMGCKNKKLGILEKRLEKNLSKEQREKFWKKAENTNHFNDIFNRK
tara:strand:- start:291 stop:506 length:216 start_codon:yes stop_codon:yes gene_type:complete